MPVGLIDRSAHTDASAYCTGIAHANGYTHTVDDVYTNGGGTKQKPIFPETNGNFLSNIDPKVNGANYTNGDFLVNGRTPKSRPSHTQGATSQGRAEETAELLHAVEELLIPFIANADNRDSDSLVGTESNGFPKPLKETLVKPFAPRALVGKLNVRLPEEGLGKDGLTSTLQTLLDYSVNTWHQGFMHKLYATTNPVGIASELILSVLNTALHVYKVSPALSVIERTTAQKLAAQFGLTGPHAGGGTHPGGSASNLAALVIARNTLFPDIRNVGNGAIRLAVFTSENSHYSITKAAQTCGIGAKNVYGVPTDSQGRMRIDSLEELVRKAREQGQEPFFVNATAGTTVLGAVDPLHAVADLCEREKLWFHVDASWGGGAIMSDKHRHKMSGAERARSITMNPHKMLGVPITCSFLLGADMRVFWRANRIEAGYLFHDSTDDDEEEVSWDLADSTLQCGRKGDSLKLALSWIYYGREGLGRYVERGFDSAQYLADKVQQHPDLVLYSTYPPPCLQICFYHVAGGSGKVDVAAPEEVTRHTNDVCESMIEKGLMIDHAPGPYGNFIRVVVNGCTTRETLDSIIDGCVNAGV